MAGETFSIWESQVVGNSAVQGNGRILLISSAHQSNNNNLNALKLVVNYEEVLPVSTVRNFDIEAVVEGSNGENGDAERWSTSGHQFSPFRRDTQGKVRVIEFSPSMPNTEQVDDIVFIGGQSLERHSKGPGKLPFAGFRICIYLSEFGYGTSGAFQSLTVSVHGEKYNV